MTLAPDSFADLVGAAAVAVSTAAVWVGRRSASRFAAIAEQRIDVSQTIHLHGLRLATTTPFDDDEIELR